MEGSYVRVEDCNGKQGGITPTDNHMPRPRNICAVIASHIWIYRFSLCGPIFGRFHCRSPFRRNDPLVAGINPAVWRYPRGIQNFKISRTPSLWKIIERVHRGAHFPSARLNSPRDGNSWCVCIGSSSRWNGHLTVGFHRSGNFDSDGIYFGLLFRPGKNLLGQREMVAGLQGGGK